MSIEINTQVRRTTKLTLDESQVQEAISSYLKSKNVPDTDQYMSLRIRETRSEESMFVMDVEGVEIYFLILWKNIK